MKHLRGHNKRYFTLAAIAMYSTLQGLSAIESNHLYHSYAFDIEKHKTSPPAALINSCL